jgi:hypothetical protein
MPFLYLNKRDGTFEEISKKVGLRRILNTMGLNYGDIDNDGYIDLYFGTGAPDLRVLMPNRMMRNHEGKYYQAILLFAFIS